MRSALLSFCILLFAGVDSGYASDAVDIALEQCSEPQSCAPCSESTCPAGTPRYVPGGTAPKEFDCSGLVKYAYGKVGFEFPTPLPGERPSQTESRAGQPIGGSAYLTELIQGTLRRGDLLFFDLENQPPSVVSHVGMYVSDNLMINAMSQDLNIGYGHLDREWATSTFLFARRVVPPSQSQTLFEIVGTINGAQAIGYNQNKVELGQSLRSSDITPGSVTTVEVTLGKFGAPTDDIIVSVRNTVSGPDLGSGRVSAAGLPDYTQAMQTVEVPLDQPVSSADINFVILRRTGVLDSNNFPVLFHNDARFGTNIYSGGTYIENGACSCPLDSSGQPAYDAPLKLKGVPTEQGISVYATSTLEVAAGSTATTSLATSGSLGSKVFAVAHARKSVHLATCTYGGLPLVSIVKIADQGLNDALFNQNVEILGLLNPPSGANTLSCTSGGPAETDEKVTLDLVSISGAVGGIRQVASSYISSVSSVLSAAITPLASKSFILEGWTASLNGVTAEVKTSPPNLVGQILLGETACYGPGAGICDGLSSYYINNSLTPKTFYWQLNYDNQPSLFDKDVGHVFMEIAGE